MKKSGAPVVLMSWAVSTLGVLGCTHDNANRKVNPIVGAWFVKDPDAPFPYHMYVFNADGTMQQANPPERLPQARMTPTVLLPTAPPAQHRLRASASRSLEGISHSFQAGQSHEIVRTRQPISPADIRNLAGIRTPQNAPILAAK